MVEHVERVHLSMSRLSYKLWLCAVVAIIGAAFADPCVEFASNAGWFGRSDFTDHSNLDVIPTLIVGLALCVAIIIRRVGQLAFGGQAARLYEWLRSLGRALRARNIAPLLPAAFVMQMLVLFSMESVEQVVVRGHLLGGVIWMGGPILASMLAHTLVCIATAYALTRTLPGFARCAARIATLIYASRIPAGDATAFRLHIDRTALVLQVPLLFGLGERAPPSPSY